MHNTPLFTYEHFRYITQAKILNFEKALECICEERDILIIILVKHHSYLIVKEILV